MEQQLNNRRIEIFKELLANPAYKDNLHAFNLEQLIKDFPQSGLLHALLLYTGDESNVHQAAAYFDPKILYKLSNITDNLPAIDPGQIVDYIGHKPAKGFFHEQTPESVEWVPSPVSEEEHEDAEHGLLQHLHEETSADEATDINTEHHSDEVDKEDKYLVEEVAPDHISHDNNAQHSFAEHEVAADENIDAFTEDDEVIHHAEEQQVAAELEQVQADDTVVTKEVAQNTVYLLVDALSFQYLRGAEIDYKEDIEGAQFIIRNPNAKTTCGCGSSFSA